MITMNKIRQQFGGNICRRCINEAFHVRLRTADCRYGNYYPYECPRCREERNIVIGLHLTGLLKLMR